MDSLGRTMENYHAWFQLERQDVYRSRVRIVCDGISLAHASARAWIKFMDMEEFKNGGGDWVLKKLELKGLK